MAKYIDPFERSPDAGRAIPDEALTAGMGSLRRGWESGRLGNDMNSLAAQEVSLRARGKNAEADTLRSQIDTLGKSQEAVAPKVGRVEDIHGVGDAGSWALGQVGQGAASMLDPLAAGTAIGAAGRVAGMSKSPLAQAFSKAAPYLGGGTAYGMNQRQMTGEIYSDMVKDPALMARTSPQDLERTANTYGAVAGAADTVLLGLVSRQLAGKGGLRMLEGMPPVKKLGLELLGEGTTEAGQEYGKQLVQGQLNPNRDTSGDASANLNAFAGGAVGSGPIAGAGVAAEHMYAGASNTGRKLGDAAGQTIDLAKGAPSAAVSKIKGLFSKGSPIDLSEPGDAPKPSGPSGFSLSGDELNTLYGVPPAGVDPQSEDFKSWFHQNNAARNQLAVDKLDELAGDDPAAAAHLDRIMGATNPTEQADATDGAAKYLAGRHEEDNVLNQAADNSRMAQAASAVGGMAATGALAAGKGVLRFGKALFGGAASALSKKNEQAAPGDEPRGGVFGNYLAASSKASPLTARSGGQHLTGLMHDIGQQLSDISSAKSFEAPASALALNRIAHMLRVTFKGQAEAKINDLQAMSAPAQKPMFDHLREVVLGDAAPHAHQARDALRRTTAMSLVGLASPEAAQELAGHPTGPTQLLGAVENVIAGKATPQMRRQLEQAVGGKERFAAMLAHMNGDSEEEGAAEHESGGTKTSRAKDSDELGTEDQDSGAETTKFEKAAGAKNVVKGSGPKVYGFANGLAPRSGGKPFAAATRDGAAHRPGLLLDSDTVHENLGGGSAIQNRIDTLRKHLKVDLTPERMAATLDQEGKPKAAASVRGAMERAKTDPAVAAKLKDELDSFFVNRAGQYNVEAKSALDVMHDNNMQPGEILAAYRDYLRQDARDMKRPEAERQALLAKARDVAYATMDVKSGAEAPQLHKGNGPEFMTEEQTKGSGIQVKPEPKDPKFRLDSGARRQVYMDAAAYFKERKVVVGEQLSDRDSSQITKPELTALAEKAAKTLDYARIAENPNAVLDEANLLIFKDGDKEVSIRAGDLVHWVRKQRGLSETSEEGSLSSASKDQTYLDAVMEGIAIVMGSDHVDQVMPYTLNAQGKKESFAKSIPPSLRLATTTYAGHELRQSKAKPKTEKFGPELDYQEKVARDQARGDADYNADAAEAPEPVIAPEDYAALTADERKELNSLKTYDEQKAFTENLSLRKSGEKFSDAPEAGSKTDVSIETPLDHFPKQKDDAVPDDFSDQRYTSKTQGFDPTRAEGVGLETKLHAKRDAAKLAENIVSQLKGDTATGIANLETRLRTAERTHQADASGLTGGVQYVYPAAHALNADTIAKLDLAPAEAKQIVQLRAKTARIILNSSLAVSEKVALTKAMAPAGSVGKITIGTFKDVLGKAAALSTDAAPEVAAQAPKSQSAPAGAGGVDLGTSGPYTKKDQAKSDQATKFIGRGSDRSSTAKYAKAWGDRANTGQYTADDVVFISAEGNRGGRVAPDFAEVGRAVKAGATVITDSKANRERDFNVGEREVAKFLTDSGYREVAPGRWQSAGANIANRARHQGVKIVGTGDPTLAAASDTAAGRVLDEGVQAWRKGVTYKQFLASPEYLGAMHGLMVHKLMGTPGVQTEIDELNARAHQMFAIKYDKELEAAVMSRLSATDENTPAKLRDMMREILVADVDPATKVIARAVNTIAGDVDVIGTQKADIRGNSGVYNPLTKVIRVAEDADLGHAGTVLHEGVHAATVAAVIRDKGLHRALYRLMDHVIEQNPKLRDAYGLATSLEFLAEGLGNISFQRELAKIKPNDAVSRYLGKTVANAWDAFVGMVRTALNLDPKHESALAQLLDLGGRTMLATKANPSGLTHAEFETFVERGVAPEKRARELADAMVNSRQIEAADRPILRQTLKDLVDGVVQDGLVPHKIVVAMATTLETFNLLLAGQTIELGSIFTALDANINSDASAVPSKAGRKLNAQDARTPRDTPASPEEIAKAKESPKSQAAPDGAQRVDLGSAGPYAAKDQAKADQANKFIGRGSPASSTSKYAGAFGDRANAGEYARGDTVFVSAEGQRGGRIDPDFSEISRAMSAGATLITDSAQDRKRMYNLGERQVAEFLAANGYRETTPGRWTPGKLNAQDGKVLSFAKARGDKVIGRARELIEGLSQEDYDTLQNDVLARDPDRRRMPSALKDSFWEWLGEYHPAERESMMAPEHQPETEMRFYEETVDFSDVPLEKALAQAMLSGATLRSADKLNAQSTDPTMPASDAQVAEAKAYVTKVLGKQVKLEFEKLTGYSGEFIEHENVIKISTQAAAGVLSTAYHEALHKFFSSFVKSDPRVLEAMRSLAENEGLLARVQALLKGFPAAQDQLKDGEERLAYIFQFMAAGKLDLPYSRATTMMQKVRKFFRRVTGMVSESERASDILYAFHDGQMSEPSAAGRVIAGIMNQGTMVASVQRKLSGVTQRANALITPSETILAKSESPAARALAKIMFTNPGDESAAGMREGYLNATRTYGARYTNAFVRQVKNLSDRDLRDITTYMQEGTKPVDIAYAPHREAVKEIRKQLQDFYKYMVDHGVKIAHAGDDYFPVVWSPANLAENRQKFIDMLTTHYDKQMQEGVVASGGKMTKENVAHRIWQSLMDRDGMDNKIEVKRDDGVLAPFFANKENRQLNWIASEHRAPFLQKTLVATLTKYFHQGVRAAEYTDRFGEDGEVLAKQLLQIRNELDAASLNKLNKQEFDSEEQRKAWVDIQMKNHERAVGAMEGSLGKDISPNLRKFNSWMMVYQNLRLLPMSLFSSFVDPMGMIARGATMREAYDTFLRGMKEVFTQWGDAFRENPKERAADKWELLAEHIGALDARMLAHNVSEEYSSAYMAPGAKRINDLLFKANGMEAWNRGMRAGATKSAVKFIERHSQIADKIHSVRWLAELGLKPEDVTLDSEGELVTEPDRLADIKGISKAQAARESEVMYQAINRWVEGAILTPNAAQRPAWASDPHYSVFFHLKQFSYSFHQTILKRAVGEMNHGNLAPLGSFAWYIPVMIAADVTKGLIQGGGSLPNHMQGYSLGDWMKHGLERSGTLGIAGIGVDASHDLFSLAGPGVEQITDAFTAPLGQTTLNALPLHGLYAQALK